MVLYIKALSCFVAHGLESGGCAFTALSQVLSLLLSDAF